jgi:hypothetical protein
MIWKKKGGDFDAYIRKSNTSRKMDTHNRNAVVLTPFAEHCISGRYEKVKLILEKHSVRNGKNWETIIQLLEKRETVLRLSPLMLVFCMLHKIGIVQLAHSDINNSVKNTIKQNSSDETWIKYIDQLEQNLIKVVIELLYYGASPIAKDVCGRTICFYGASVYATSRSLLATTMCINAAISAHFFGKEIIIQGFETTTDDEKKSKYQNDNTICNGMRGLAAGYQVDTGRRIVFLFGRRTEVAVFNRNICLPNDDGSNQPMINLCNVQDRLGHVCLTELIGSKRRDVIEFLLQKHHVSIDIPDWTGQTLRRRSFIIKMNAALKSKALDDVHMNAQIIVTEAVKRARLEQRREEHTCTGCSSQQNNSNENSQRNPLQVCQRWYVPRTENV